MKKIAPMLHHHVSMPVTKTYFTLEDMKQGQAELRALLAVAKAAKRARFVMVDVARYGRNTHQGEIDGDLIGRRLENATWDDLDKHLARLDRLRAPPAAPKEEAP